MIRRVLSVFVHTKGAFLYCICTLAGTALSYVAPYLNGQFVDFLIHNRSVEKNYSFALFVALVGLGATLLSYYSGILAVRISSLVSNSILKDLVLSYERRSFYLVKDEDKAYVAQKFFTDTSISSSFVLSNFLTAPLGVMVLPLVLTIIFLIDPLFSLIAVFLLCLYCCLIAVLGKAFYLKVYEKKEADSHYFSLIESQINQLLNLQLFSRYEKSRKELTTGFRDYILKVISYGKINYLLSSVDSIFSIIFQCFVVLISGIHIMQGSMTVGEFVIVNTYFTLIFNVVKGYIGLYKSYQEAMSSWKRIKSVLISAHTELAREKQRLTKIDSITVKNLNYQVQIEPEVGKKSVKTIFSSFSYCFENSHSYCIIGKNGSGKTSLLYFLLGLYDSGGSVFYNGLIVDSIDLEHVRSVLISTCPQELFRSDLSVEDYLSFLGTPFVIENDSNYFSKKCPFIYKRVYSLLYKQCKVLSGGELRLIYLYSVLTRKTPVILLDEPTTGLDRESKSELVNYIKKNPFKQMFIIASHDEGIISAVNSLIFLGASVLQHEE